MTPPPPPAPVGPRSGGDDDGGVFVLRKIGAITGLSDEDGDVVWSNEVLVFRGASIVSTHLSRRANRATFFYFFSLAVFFVCFCMGRGSSTEGRAVKNKIAARAPFIFPD